MSLQKTISDAPATEALTAQDIIDIKTSLQLEHVNNTSDINKPVSTAQAAAIQDVADALDSHVIDNANPHNVTAAQVGAYTDAQVDALLQNKISLGGDITGTEAAPLVANGAITNAKLANISSGHFKARTAAGVGEVEDISEAEVKTLLNLPSDTISELANKLPFTGGTLTGALNGNQPVSLHLRQGLPIKSDITLSLSNCDQFFTVSADLQDIQIELIDTQAAPQGAVWEFLVTDITNTIIISNASGNAAFTNVSPGTLGNSQSLTVNQVGASILVRYLGANTYQITGSNIE